MVLNCLFPVFALIGLGVLLKRIRLLHDSFLQSADRLVYFIFFPAMLFWKIGGADTTKLSDWRYCQAALLALLTLFVISLAAIRILKIRAFQAGTFNQSCYRFNTYIGMAIVLNAAGEEGGRYFGILAGLLIPVINFMAVSTLIWYAGPGVTLRRRLRLTLSAIISNPLILACLAGLLYARFINRFPVFLDHALALMAMGALPLALLSVGAALSFQRLRGYVALSLLAAGCKLLLFPLLGYFFLQLLDVRGVPFQVTLIFCALPTSTAVYILSSQLHSDTGLASASIVMSTLLSFLSLTIVLVR